MRRLAVAAVASLLFGAVAMAVSAAAPPEPPIVHVTTRSGEGLWSVATRLCPNAVGTAYTALQQLNPWVVGTGLDPGTVLHWDPTLCPTPVTTTSSTPSTSSLPTSTALTTTSTLVPPSSSSVPPATTTSTTTSSTIPAVTSTTAPISTSTTSSPPTTMPMPPTTLPPGGFPVAPIADIPSNYNTAGFVHNDIIPGSTANEPSGNFRTICRPSHYAHHDPIVNPGGTSSHLHLFFGNTAANNYSTYTTLRTSGQSTCEGGPNNRTGYWMPAMFDSQGRVIPPTLIIVYYKAGDQGFGTLAQRHAQIALVRPLPNGLRMIAGAPGGHASYQCGDGTNSGSTIPNNCPTGYLIAQVAFPDCWDGVHLDSVDHRSHVAYRSYVNGQYICPTTHPVQIPSITESFHWTTGATDVGSWRLSSDMGAPRGSTLHADWFGAWDNPVMMRWYNSCLIGMRNANNGNLCDGQSLTSAAYVGAIQSGARLTGYIPNAPQ